MTALGVSFEGRETPERGPATGVCAHRRVSRGGLDEIVFAGQGEPERLRSMLSAI